MNKLEGINNLPAIISKIGGEKIYFTRLVNKKYQQVEILGTSYTIFNQRHRSQQKCYMAVCKHLKNQL